MYDDLGYARQRLDSSYIRYKGLPVYVTEITGEFNLRLYCYGGKKEFNKNINDPDLDFKPIPLGYVNYKAKTSTETGYKILNEAYYLERAPQRRMKQGLVSNSVVCRHRNMGRGIANTLLQLPLYNLIAEKFKPYAEVVKNIKVEESIAFDRRLAIRKVSYGPKVLMYRGRDIGYFESTAKSFAIGEDHMYLQELLRHHGVQCHADE